jgi:hypothetical protein
MKGIEKMITVYVVFALMALDLISISQTSDSVEIGWIRTTFQDIVRHLILHMI